MVRPGPALLEEMKNDLIEMFFFPEGHIQPMADIDVAPVGSFRPVCVVRSAHPLVGRTGLTLGDLTDCTWACTVDPPIPEHLLSESRFVCDNYHILLEAVLKCDLICICSSAFVARELASGEVCEIQVNDLPLPVTTIYVAKLLGRISSPLAVQALERMKKHLGTACL
jgi:DNA-binding transcriptional LysR family regulator